MKRTQALRNGGGLLLALSTVAVAMGATNEPPAKLSVKGYGLFGNRELKSLVSMLEPPGQKPAAFHANFVEDAVLILFSRLRRDGFLYPSVRATATFEDGRTETFTWTEPLGEPLPRPFAATRVEFAIDE